MLKIRRNKRGVLNTWFDYVFAVVVGLVVFIVVFALISSDKTGIEKQIKGKTETIRDDVILTSYLGMPLIELPTKGQEGMTKEQKQNIEAVKGITVADLIDIVGISTGDEKEAYKKLLELETIYALNKTFEKEPWKISVKYPSGEEIAFGEVSGQTRVSETEMPSSDHKLITISLITQGETIDMPQKQAEELEKQEEKP